MVDKLSLVTEDLKNLVKASIPSANIRKYEFGFINRFNVGRIIIRYQKGSDPALELPESVNKNYMKLWKNDVGSVFVKELKKESPEIYELVAGSFKALIKKISDDELESFRQNGFDHLVLADSVYTILKAVGSRKSYSEISDDYELDEDYQNGENLSQIIENDSTYNEQPNDSYELF